MLVFRRNRETHTRSLLSTNNVCKENGQKVIKMCQSKSELCFNLNGKFFHSD